MKPYGNLVENLNGTFEVYELGGKFNLYERNYIENKLCRIPVAMGKDSVAECEQIVQHCIDTVFARAMAKSEEVFRKKNKKAQPATEKPQSEETKAKIREEEKSTTDKKQKSCGNCVNCDKKSSLGWICEEYGFYFNGASPVKCSPPNDEACKLWTDNPTMKNTWQSFV